MLYCTNDFVAHKIFCVNREIVKCTYKVERVKDVK